LNFLLSPTINEISSQHEDKQNFSAATTIFDKIGREGANQLRQDFLDDAMDKMNTIIIRNRQMVSESYEKCKNKSKINQFITFVS
jgi:hypothetical protein